VFAWYMLSLLDCQYLWQIHLLTLVLVTLLVCRLVVVSSGIMAPPSPVACHFAVCTKSWLQFMLRGCMYRLVDPVVFAAHCSTVWLPLIHAALCCSVLEEHGPLGFWTENSLYTVILEDSYKNQALANPGPWGPGCSWQYLMLSKGLAPADGMAIRRILRL
jgi:hypothetical protein